MTQPFQAEAMVFKILGDQFAIPRTYLVLDTETTGFSRDKDYIVDAGWAVVHDRKIVHQQSFLIDWSKMPGVNTDEIQWKLRKQATDYAQKGLPHYYPWERLKAEGDDPRDVLYHYTKLIYEHIQNPNSIVVGHGFRHFDRFVIDSHTQRFLQGYLLPWKLNSVIDTGMWEKAAQTNRPPYQNESLDEWQKRMSGGRATCKWSLGEHCVPKYRLVERYNVDMRFQHTAGFDCVLTHYLLQTYQELIEILNGERHVLTGNSSA